MTSLPTEEEPRNDAATDKTLGDPPPLINIFGSDSPSIKARRYEEEFGREIKRRLTEGAPDTVDLRRRILTRLPPGLVYKLLTFFNKSRQAGRPPQERQDVICALRTIAKAFNDLADGLMQEEGAQ